LSLEFLLRWRSRVFPLHTLPFGFWLIVMDPCFISCDYSAQKFFFSLVHTAGGAAMLHCHSSKENDAIKVKLRSRYHSSTNSKHACAEGSVTNLNRCYGESADNFLLTYVLSVYTVNTLSIYYEYFLLFLLLNCLIKYYFYSSLVKARCSTKCKLDALVSGSATISYWEYGRSI
jgi:hypothetical protein